MTRLTHSHRIVARSGTQRCTPGRATAAALAASVAVLAIGGVSSLAPTGVVFAQTSGTAGPISFNLFAGDSVDLNPKEARRLVDAARTAQAPGQCPLGRLTFYSSERDPLFQKATVAARRDAVLQYLNSQGIDPSRFFADAAFAKDDKRNDVELDLNAGRDQTAPTLVVEWTPPKGTKVKANQRITAKAIARDDTNRWQTGINTIDLDVQGGGSFGFQDYPRPQPPCANPPPSQTLEGVYTVPSDPPPIVRLRAVTKDFAGHDARDIAEFPTGDWYGTFEVSADSVVLGVRTTIKDHMDIALEYDGKGNLTGSLVGNRSFNQQGSPNCNWSVTIPNKLRGKLLGSYTPGAEVMSIRLVEPVVGPAPKKEDCPRGGWIYSGDSLHDDADFKRVLGSPRAVGGGTFRSSFVRTTGPVTYSLSLTLRPARD